MRHDFNSEWWPSLLTMAQDAGEEIMGHFRAAGGPTRLSDKNDNSPLTMADLASNCLLTNALRQLTPAIPVVSEEDPRARQQAVLQNSFWLIDPLDGTKEFLGGSGEFTVNIAFIHRGSPLAGVVYAPAMRQLYWGEPGLGAYRREPDGTATTLHVAPAVTEGNIHRIIASKSHLDENTRAFIDRFMPYHLIQAGSSLKFCRLAEGLADLYPRLAPTCEWDTAAAQAIVEAAGGQVTDLEGVPLRYGKPDVLNPHFVATTTPLLEMLHGH